MEVPFWIQMGPVFCHFGSPKGPRRHPQSVTFLRGPKMTSKIALGGVPWTTWGLRASFLSKHSTRYFRTVRSTSCSKASWRKVRPHLHDFWCFLGRQGPPQGGFFRLGRTNENQRKRTKTNENQQQPTKTNVQLRKSAPNGNH